MWGFVGPGDLAMRDAVRCMLHCPSVDLVAARRSRRRAGVGEAPEPRTQRADRAGGRVPGTTSCQNRVRDGRLAEEMQGS